MALSYQKIVNAGLGMSWGIVALALEMRKRPRQTLCRLQGWVYRYLMGGSHRTRLADYEGHLMPVDRALALVTGRDEQDVLGISYDDVPEELCTGPSQGRACSSPIPLRYGASRELEEVIYKICLLLRPSIVVETGVGSGLTSRAILAALEDNGFGHLYSVELPGLARGYARDVGHAVSQQLRERWFLIFGPSRTVLPNLLREVGTIQVFVHDSTHDYHGQKKDYEVALDHMAPGGILISDDVINNAFIEVSEARATRWCMIQQSKPSPIGIMYVDGPES